MANKARGEADLDLGGKTFMIRMDMNALAELDDLLGQSCLAVLQTPDKIGVKFVRAAIYAGTRYDRRLASRYTLNTIGELMEFAELGAYVETIVSALTGSIGAQSDDEAKAGGKNQKKEPATTESTSTSG